LTTRQCPGTSKTILRQNEEDVAGDRSLEETLPPDQNNQFDLEGEDLMADLASHLTAPEDSLDAQVDSQSREGLEDPVVTPNSLVNLSNINTIDISSGTCLASLDDGNIQHRPKFKDTPSTFEVYCKGTSHIIAADQMSEDEEGTETVPTTHSIKEDSVSLKGSANKEDELKKTTKQNLKSYPEEMFDEEDVEDVEFEYIRENVLDYAKDFQY